MKICSTCQQKYSDSLEYCLQDGTVLSALPDPNATLRLGSRPTQSETSQTKSPLAIIIAAVAGLLLLAVLVVVVAVVVYMKSANQPVTTANPSTNPAVNTGNDRDWTNAQPTKEEMSKQIEQINDEIGSALVQIDLDTLDRLLADDYVYENDLGTRLTKQQILTMFRTGSLRYDYVTSTNSRVVVDNTLTKGVLTSQAQSKGRLQGRPFNDKYTYTNTYEKRGSGWQLVSGRAWYR
jgi:archaellum component FlaF (FlaF/FlaG flagellin family)